MLKQFAARDVVIVTQNDRLARSAFDRFARVKRFTDVKVLSLSLAKPFADTSADRLKPPVLGRAADVDRDLIHPPLGRGPHSCAGQWATTSRRPALIPQPTSGSRQRRQDGATLNGMAGSYNVGPVAIWSLGV